MEWKSRAHPISDVRDWSNASRLELKPDFQRNVVWSKAAQIALIDTILHNIPMPKIYIKSIIYNEKTYRVVIDGQQRLTAILAFLDNKLKLKTPHITMKEFDGFTFSELPEDVKNKVLSYNLDFNEIFNPTEDELRNLYARVNKYTVQLNKQELRRADFPGEFLNLAEELADLEFFLDNKFFSVGQKRRMLDVEYVEELLALLLEGEQDKKDSLDDFCERYALFPQGINAVRVKFESIINDIAILFEGSVKLSTTRFKQKADFYTLFGCIVYFKKQGYILAHNFISKVQKKLVVLTEQIEPHSENEDYRNYAIRCISDANSYSSRRWRKEFLKSYLTPLYVISKASEEVDK